MYASTARSTSLKWCDVDHAGMAAIFSSLLPTVRHDLQCCENTNWLPRNHPVRV